MGRLRSRTALAPGSTTPAWGRSTRGCANWGAPMAEICQGPLRALELAAEWSRLLDVVSWLQAHPRPGVYLRQVDLPGIHTKFIESQRGVLADLGLNETQMKAGAPPAGAGLRGSADWRQAVASLDKALARPGLALS